MTSSVETDATGTLRETGEGPALRHDFAARPGSVGAAREAARLFLAELALHRLPAASHAGSDVLVAVSELVTNAVRHAPGPGTLELAYQDGEVHVTVRDAATRMPRARTPSLDGAGGFGLPFLRRLTTDFSVTVLPAGKEVRAVLPWDAAGPAR